MTCCVSLVRPEAIMWTNVDKIPWCHYGVSRPQWVNLALLICAAHLSAIYSMNTSMCRFFLQIKYESHSFALSGHFITHDGHPEKEIYAWYETYRDHFVYAPSQWEMMLQCNFVTHDGHPEKKIYAWCETYRDHFVYAPSQWGMTIQCNFVTHDGHPAKENYAWYETYRDHFVYAPSKWKMTLHVTSSLIGWAHSQKGMHIYTTCVPKIHKLYPRLNILKFFTDCGQVLVRDPTWYHTFWSSLAPTMASLIDWLIDSFIYQIQIQITTVEGTQRSNAYQSGTKPNLAAKILATKFGVFFVIYVML